MVALKWPQRPPNKLVVIELIEYTHFLGDRVIEEDMTLVVELYAGAVGGDHGVKLGDQVLVTADGLEILAPYPFNEGLLG